MAFNYWMIVKKLLGMGLPWDVIDTLSDDTVYLLLAFNSAIETKEADEFSERKFLKEI